MVSIFWEPFILATRFIVEKNIISEFVQLSSFVKSLHMQLGSVSEKTGLNQATLIVCFQTNSKYFSKAVSGLC